YPLSLHDALPISPVLVLSHWGVKVRNGGRSAGDQSRKLDDVETVGGEVRNHCSGNGLTHFTAIRLNLNGIGFDGDALFGLADLKGRVGADGVIHVERNAVQFVRFEPRQLYPDIVASDHEFAGDIAAG